MSYILCDHKCPLHQSCAFYCEGFDKTKTDHWGVMPYKNGKCQGYKEIEFDIGFSFLDQFKDEEDKGEI